MRLVQKLDRLMEIILDPILYLLRRKLDELGRGIFLIEGANLVEENLTHLVNENIVLVQVDKSTQRERLIAKGFNDNQTTKRIKFQLKNKERIRTIIKRQQREFDRLLIKVDGSRKINTKEVYEKLQEEYRRRFKIVR